ncbi:MAG: secretin N-terminal domain-containing protein [Alphaproteobacteria bacterium]
MTSLRVATLGVAVLVSLMAAAVSAFSAEGIPWKADTVFERTSVDEDVKDVLRGLLRANGQQVIFKPGVKGTVSFRFQNMPLQAAFAMLVTENGLDYSYDAATNTVTILGEADSRTTQDFVNLGLVDPDALRGAMKEFGLSGGLIINKGTGTALLKGTPEQVKLLKSLITDMVANARALAETRTADSTASSTASTAASTAAKASAEAALAESRLAADRAVIENLVNQHVRVIPLRYANVGPSTKKFYDEQVTVPGIEQTIGTLLGDIEGMTKNLPKEQADRLKDMMASINMARPVVTADARTNSVIVRGTPEAIEQVATLIMQLDRPVPLIEIEVMIVRAAEGTSSKLGVNWAGGQRIDANGRETVAINTGIASANVNNPDIQNKVQTTTASNSSGEPVSTSVETVAAKQLINALTLLPTAGAGEVLAGFVTQSSRSALQAEIHILESDNRAQTIASPKVVTLNNTAAKMSKRDSRYIPIQGAAGSVGTIKEINAGVTLDILPSVILSADPAETPLVRLNITASDTIPDVAPGATSVSVAGNVVTTEVMVPNNTTFVLGGMFNDGRTRSTSGIPFLRDIPVLGNLFGMKQDANSLDETIFFITPRVVMPNEIAPVDVATRRYMQRRQLSLSETGRDLQLSASYLGLKPNIHEAE